MAIKAPKYKTTRNLFDKKSGKSAVFYTDFWKKGIGSEASLKGCWIIQGPEKNGKTTAALMLARELAYSHRVLYVSGEEGLGTSFKLAVKRAGITMADKILWEGYIPLAGLMEKLNKRNSPDIIFVDNLTIYADEFKDFKFFDVINRFPNKLFIFLAHEERKEAFPAVAKLARKLSPVIIQISGLKGFIISRYDGIGGNFIISEEHAEIFWGIEE